MTDYIFVCRNCEKELAPGNDVPKIIYIDNKNYLYCSIECYNHCWLNRRPEKPDKYTMYVDKNDYKVLKNMAWNIKNKLKEIEDEQDG